MDKNSHTERRKTKSLRVPRSAGTIDAGGAVLPEIRNHSTISERKKDFNRYYIAPALRYKPKIDNPKEDPENYEDETFIYRNLHNYQFWNWVHPLSDYRLRPAPDELAKKVSIQALDNFRHYIEHRTNSRIPGIVKELLNRQHQHR